MFLRNNKIIIALLVCAGILTAASFVFAQSDLGLNDFANQTSLGTKPLGQIIAEIVRIFLSILGIIAVIIILYAGFLWMTAAGNADKIATAKKLIINAVIGLAIILASLAITQFILSALQNATGTRIEGTEEGAGGGGEGFGSDSFALQGISPRGNVAIRNVVVRVALNHAPSASTINGNVLVIKKSDNSITDMSFTISNNSIDLIPSLSCPAPNASVKCLEANTAYRVEVKTGLKDSGGKSLVCGGLAPSCTAEFTTGSLIDTAPPTVNITYPDPGQSVPQNGFVDVWATATDDSAVSHIEFFADGAYFDNDFPATSASSFDGRVLWNTSSITKGSHNLTARAYDIDSNNAFSPALNVIVRAEHCFNAARDVDETGIDCGGADCAICTGGTCSGNGDCASGSCQSGVCVDTPIILGVSPADGAPGTYVTIKGRYFGTTAGTVTFLGGEGATDDKVAQLAPCSGAWSNTQVVVVVPQGITTNGPIEIKNSIGSDTTNNARGPALPNYVITPTLRPGICALNPVEGKSGTDFTVTGDGFGGSQGTGSVKFGNTFAVPKNWTSRLITAIVPVLGAGENSVSVVQNGVESNAVNFNVLSPTAGTKPLISYVNPDKGPIGEYITLFGSNFGDKPGVVEFLRQDGTKATGDANFPTVCGLIDYWHNTSITIKVPDKFSDGGSTLNSATSLRIRRIDNELSNTLPFNINNTTPSPGICGLKPNNGPIGTSVDVLGERFGATGSVTFYNNVNATVSAWGSEIIKANVPTGAVSGPVKITVAGKGSNSVNFSVGDCGKTPSLCGAEEQCCNSSCIAKTAQCQTVPKQGAYAWRISTGVIPKSPHVVEDCSTGESANTPSPSPWNSRPGGNSVCLNAIINIRFDSKLDRNTVIMNGLAADTVALYKCTGTVEGKDPCATRAKIAANPTYSGIYSAGTESDGLQFYPAGGLEKNTSYLVELSTKIRGAGQGGGYMEAKEDCGNGLSYCFKFKTADSTGLCRVGGLVTSPQTMVSEEQEFLDYLSLPRSKDDVCLSLDASAYSFTWSSSQTVKAAINRTGIGLDDIQRTNAAIIQTLAETLPNDPAIITSSILTENVSGKGNLTIDFSDPIVVSKWPSCTTACINSIIGAQFNVNMDPATITLANINVFRCKTENCDSFDGQIAGNISYQSDLKQFEFIPSQSLEINKFYLVRLNTFGIRSTSGVNLTGANSQNYFVWQFKTRTDATSCTINKININPETAALNYIGEKIGFDSEALGAPDSCSPQGQKLNPYAYGWNWSSTVPAVANLLRNGTYNVLPLGNKSCNDQCLHNGSRPGLSVCGNAKVEKGESCDDGNTRFSDGCSDKCLNEGTNAPTCGNNTKDRGEDCDDGNVKSGDGCSDKCLAEGATAGQSICGNNFVGKGENCDDENSISGDGCSNQCLNEGSSGGVASCGNGVPEYSLGEDCDDGNTASGDGCSATCRNEGSVAGGSVCGNSVIEKGESCDDGNIVSGDGCSSQCLNEGSSLEYLIPSVCGNQIQETGEDRSCDGFASADGNVDPRQYAEALAQGNTKIRAAIGNVKGESDVEVLCVYTTDAQCQAFAKPGETLGAGLDNCCWIKPQLTVIAPIENSSGVCRNTLVSFSFNQIMDANAGIISIDEAKNGNCPAGSTASADGLWCEAAIKATRSVINLQDLGQTKFDVNIANVLKSNTRYRIQVKDFKNSKGVLGINRTWLFTTGADICKFEKINFNPNPVILSKIETIPVVAQAISLNNNQEQQIAPVAGVYEWTWGWTPVDIGESVSLTNISAATVLATAKQKNGNGYLNAMATITKDIYKLSSDNVIIDQVPITVFLCENPWPADGNGRMTYFTDPDPARGIAAPGNNFRTYYCRDTKSVCKSGKCTSGTKACNTDADCLLPYLSTANVTANIGAMSDITRELLFTESKSGDAIGIRVYKNLDHLSPLSWYKAKQFVGQPQATSLDGYSAIADGRSTYINAANHTESGTNYTNIFVVSYNQGATADMQNIYKQMMDNFKFNTNLSNFKVCAMSGKYCSNDLECGAGDVCRADKDKIARDTKRLADLRDMSEMIEVYKTKSSTYPQMISGTYLRGWSVSTWPSWQATLANDLGKALQSDPINKYAGCSAPYDSITCWNGTAGQYMCPAGSRVYQYRYLATGAGENYQLGSDFEYNNSAGWSNIGNNFAINGVCTGQGFSTSANCGDGVVGEMEQCEKGNTATQSCLINGKSGFKKLTCNATCQWDESAPCLAGQCGDGVKQTTEICDDGQNNGRYGYCNTSCTGLGMHCGDGTKNDDEQCDAGVANGQYGSGCSWDCKTPGPSCGDKIINGGEACDGNSETTKNEVYYSYIAKLCYTDAQRQHCTLGEQRIGTYSACTPQNGYETEHTRTCGSDCKWGSWGACMPKGSCGNGAVEASEQCDTGSNGGTSGVCVMDLVKGYACKNAICGDGYLQSGKEVCDSGVNNGKECDPAYGLTCNYCSTTCSTITKTGAYCGDAKKNGPEQCDGNDFGSLSCRSFGFLEFSSGTYANRTALTCPDKCTANTSKCASIIRMNAGGPGYTDNQGNIWVPDVYFSSGAGSWADNALTIGNTDNQTIYKSERNSASELRYSFPTGHGTFKVRLHFAEIFHRNSSDIGKRVFNVSIEGQNVLTNFDVQKEVGLFNATVKEFVVTVDDDKIQGSSLMVADHTLDIVFSSVIGGPKVSAIEIESSSTGGLQYTPDLGRGWMLIEQ